MSKLSDMLLPIEKDSKQQQTNKKEETKDFLYKAALIIFSIAVLYCYIYQSGYNAGAMETSIRLVSIYAGAQ